MAAETNPSNGGLPAGILSWHDEDMAFNSLADSVIGCIGGSRRDLWCPEDASRPKSLTDYFKRITAEYPPTCKGTAGCQPPPRGAFSTPASHGPRSSEPDTKSLAFDGPGIPSPGKRKPQKRCRHCFKDEVDRQEAIERMRAAIAETPQGEYATAKQLIKKACIRRDRGVAALRILEQLGEYHGFMRSERGGSRSRHNPRDPGLENA